MTDATSPLRDGVDWPVRTERLVLRPATPADADATWRFRRLDSVNRWLTRATATLDEHRTHDHGGCGYATEAVGALIGLCFTDLGLRRVTAICFAENEVSWRLMERIGMRRESYNVRESLHRSRQWLDSIAYALLADERRVTG